MRLPGGKVQRCVLQDVLHVPNLSYSLVSVSKASGKGKVTEFDGVDCSSSGVKVVAMAMRCSSLYFLDCQSCEQANVVGSNEDLWHKRYGHLGYDDLRHLAVEDGINFNSKKLISFCEACTEGKHHRGPFLAGGSTKAEGMLDLVYVLKSKGEVFQSFVSGRQWLSFLLVGN